MTPVFAMLYKDVDGEQVPIARVLGVAILEGGVFTSFVGEDSEDIARADTLEILGLSYQKKKIANQEYSVDTFDGEPPEEVIIKGSTKTIYLTPKQ